MTRADSPLPTGVITFLLTDIEGSTQAWQAAPDRMVDLVSRHYAILDAAIAAHGGVRPQEQGEGDSVVAAFHDPAAAVAAAVEAQSTLRSEVPEVPVRMALHTGEARLRNEDNYVGLTIIRCARIRSCGHGGQILLSTDTADAVRDTLDAPLGLVDLGLYGLKGLDGRERIWQLTAPGLQIDFPPLSAGVSAAGNLPAPITTFVGRRRELTAVGEAVAAHRLVTLTGGAGIGKTRLAMAAASALADSMPGGVWWIPLTETPADDADSVAASMLHACALPRSADDPVDALIGHFGSIARSLVVLDGADRVQAAAAAVALRLLGQCPETQVLCTGVGPLHVPGEVVVPVPAMTMPPGTWPDGSGGGLDALVGFDATRLFVERSTTSTGRRFVDADATVVAELCRKLRGAPLAIELAAARVGSAPLSELADSLGALVDADGPTDLARTLASSIEWTYQLLDVEAQTALRCLGVFRGDIEIDAATTVLRGVLDERTAATALRTLFDQQLITFDAASGRATMSTAVRTHALGLLRGTDQHRVATARHGAWFASVAERFGDDADTGEALPMSLLAPDEADVLAALDASMGADPPAVAYRILVALGSTWSSLGHPEVGERCARWLSTRSPGDGEEMWAAAVARACHERAGDPASPIHGFADEALAIAELVGDRMSPRHLAEAATSVHQAMAERP